MAVSKNRIQKILIEWGRQVELGSVAVSIKYRIQRKDGIRREPQLTTV